MCFKHRERQIIPKFQSLKRVLTEDKKEFMSPKKFQDVVPLSISYLHILIFTNTTPDIAVKINLWAVMC